MTQQLDTTRLFHDFIERVLVYRNMAARQFGNELFWFQSPELAASCLTRRIVEISELGEFQSPELAASCLTSPNLNPCRTNVSIA